MKQGCLTLSAAVTLMVALPVQAALNPAGAGLISDTLLNITWLQDGNLVKTSCDANNTLWQAFDPTLVATNTRSKTDICNDNGRLNWDEAQAWIAVLNSQNFRGYNDWRQPVAEPVNGLAHDSTFTFDGSTDIGFNISAAASPYPGSTASELAHLFYNSLANQGRYDTAGNDQASTYCVGPSACLQNSGPFNNTQEAYWTGSQDATNPAVAIFFLARDGLQRADFKDLLNLMVWPVRSSSGPVAPATVQPVPILGGFGLAVLGGLLSVVAGRRLKK